MEDFDMDDGPVTIENDIPEGVARIEAMDHALKTATPGEDPRTVLVRAELYYRFLTNNRQSYQIAGGIN